MTKPFVPLVLPPAPPLFEDDKKGTNPRRITWSAVILFVLGSAIVLTRVSLRLQMTPVLVARQRLPQYQRIDDPEKQFCIERRWKSEVPAGYLPVEQLKSAERKNLRRTLAAGEVLTADNLYRFGCCEVVLRRGMRAMSLTRCYSRHWKTIEPDSHVRLIVKKDGRSVVVFDDVVVLAVDWATGDEYDGAQNLDLTGCKRGSLTIECHPDECEEVQALNGPGELIFAYPVGDDPHDRD